MEWRQRDSSVNFVQSNSISQDISDKVLTIDKLMTKLYILKFKRIPD